MTQNMKVSIDWIKDAIPWIIVSGASGSIFYFSTNKKPVIKGFLFSLLKSITVGMLVGFYYQGKLTFGETVARVALFSFMAEVVLGILIALAAEVKRNESYLVSTIFKALLRKRGIDIKMEQPKEEKTDEQRVYDNINFDN